jgi:TRAP-type mannitol/chloroaromatic compound transport system substrate-binding protein
MGPCIISMPTGHKLSRRTALGAGAAALAAPTIARAQTLRWRMVTSWPKNRTGPGISARRIVERINAMSGGRLQIDLFAAGEIVPPFAVLDAVSNGTVEIGHTASLYWQGRIPAAGFFTSVPFGLGPIEHQAWIELRDGQALWDELYKPHGVRAFIAGNTGPSMGGWFRRKLNGVEDLRGMRLRVQGLGAELYARLGAVPMAVSAGDLLPALEKGSIDAAEFLAPATDLETGLPKYASFYYAPGFNKPNGASELMVSLLAWDRLTPDLRSIIAEACRAEHTLGLAEAYQTNAVALTEILGKYPVTLEAFPRPIMDAAQAASAELMAELGGTSSLASRIVESYKTALQDLRGWSALAADMARANTRAHLPAR